MKLFGKVLDERQESEAMRVERVGFYGILFGLLLVIIVQVLAFGKNAHVHGELIVMTAGAIWGGIGYFRRGIYDPFTKPGMKSYITYGIITGVICGVLFSPPKYLSYGAYGLYLRIFAKYFTIMFAIGFIVYLLVGTVTKARQRKLQTKYEDDGKGI